MLTNEAVRGDYDRGPRMANEPQRASLPQSMDRLEKSALTAHEVLGELESRLSPVLCLDMPRVAGETRDRPRPPASPVGDHAAKVAEMTDDLTARVRRILELLDV
jgi:hypothetical protein